METRFIPPEYHTPEDKPQSRKHRMLPGHSLQFLWDTLIGSVFWGRNLARKGKFTEREMAEGAVKVLDAVEDSGGCVHVTGLQHVADTPGAVVFAGNHMGTLETLIMPCLVYPFRECSFVVKKILVEGKIFGPIMRELQPIAVGRENPRDDLKTVLSQGAELLGKGRSIVIFPQTTRRPDFDPESFNSLGVKLAKRAGVKLIPVALKTDFWVPGKIFRDLGRVYPDRDVHFAFGPPIDCSGAGHDAHRETIDFITARLKEWGVECRQARDKNE